MNEMTLLVNAARTDPILRDAALAVEKRLLEAQRSYETAERAAVMWMERAEAAEARCARLQQALDRAITTLEYVGGADLIVQELREVSEASGTGSSAAGSGESPMPEGERQGRQPVPEESREALAGPDMPADSQDTT